MSKEENTMESQANEYLAEASGGEESQSSLPLHQRVRFAPLGDEAGKALLRRLLVNLTGGAADTHLLVARALFASSADCEEPEKSLILDQIFFCLARALEDFALLCLTAWEEGRAPLELYLKRERAELRAFYARCRRNALNAEQLFRSCNVASYDMLQSHPVFGKIVRPEMAGFLDMSLQRAGETLGCFGRLYHASLGDADPQLGPWQVAYANAPLGLKLLFSRELGLELLMGIEESPDAANPEKSALKAQSALVCLDEDWVERVLVELEAVCREIRLRAELKLAFLDGASVWLAKLKELYGKETPALVESESEVASPPQPKPKREGHFAIGDPTTAIKGEVKQVGSLKIVHAFLQKKSHEQT